MKLDHHRGPVTAVRVCPASDVLVSGSHDTTICLWSLDTFSLLNLIQMHKAVLNIQLSCDSVSHPQMRSTIYMYKAVTRPGLTGDSPNFCQTNTINYSLLLLFVKPLAKFVIIHWCLSLGRLLLRTNISVIMDARNSIFVTVQTF